MARKPSPRKQIEKLLEKHSPLIRDAFLKSIAGIRSKVVLKRMADRLAAGDIAGAIEAIGLERAAFSELEEAIRNAYRDSGNELSGSLPTLRDQSGHQVIFQFDIRNQRAEQWLASHSSALVTGIIDDQRRTIMAALSKGLEAGLNPNSVALDIAGRVNKLTRRRSGGLIGLSGPQSTYVDAVRRELRDSTAAGMRNYLTRERRNKRFDRMVARAIREKKPLPKSTVDKIAGKYSDNLLLLRAETIARTEALSSVHNAKDEAFRQGLDKTNYPPEAVSRVWRSAGDGKVRHSHSAMNGAVSTGLDSPFRSPTGALLRFPGDTSLGAGAEEVINCRCDTDYRIDFSSGVS